MNMTRPGLDVVILCALMGCSYLFDGCGVSPLARQFRDEKHFGHSWAHPDTAAMRAAFLTIDPNFPQGLKRGIHFRLQESHRRIDVLFPLRNFEKLVH